MDVHQLIAKRGYLKGSCTRIFNFVLDEKLQQPASSLLEVKKQRLMELFLAYQDVSIQIACLDPTDKEDVGVFEDKYATALAKLSDMIADKQTSQSQSVGICVNDHRISNVKLPAIDIESFSGQYADYSRFINIFTSMIHNNPTLDNVQRLYYLRKFLVGEPLDLIKNLPIAEATYIEALSLLKNRYDNKYLIMSDHINKLLEIAPSLPTAPSLREFASCVNQGVKALTSIHESVAHWDIILVHLLSKKLDATTANAFQLSRDSKQEPTIIEFIQFIEKRALALESVQQCTHSLPCNNAAATYHRGATERSSHPSSSSTLQCINCKLDHKLFNCAKFKLLPIQDRLELVKSNDLCQICLNKHPNKRCRYYFRCSHCKLRDHNTLLHVDEPAIASGTVTLTSSAGHSLCLLPTARVNLMGQDGTKYDVKVLLDSGSQVSFVTTELVQRLGLTPATNEVTIVGVTNVNNKVKYSIPLEIQSRISPFKMLLNCHVVDSITCKLPQTKLDISKIYIPPGLQLADNNFNTPGDIHILMGCDAFFQVLLPQQSPATRELAQHNVQPTIINTHFGHVIGGSLPEQTKTSKQISLHCQVCQSDTDQLNSDLNDNLQAFWKTEEVPQIFIENSSEILQSEEIFKETVQLQNNKFQVDLPLKIPLDQVNKTLGNSFDLALKRFLNLEKKFTRLPDLLEKYKNFIHEYIELGHGHYVDIETIDLNKDAIYFLPHHAVFNESSRSTKTRVVFDGSMLTNKKVSLNNILLNGALLQKDLFEIMLLFRLGDYTITTDIRRMFRAITMNPTHTSLQNILWRDTPSEPIRCIRLDTVTYGLKSSTFLATRCLFELAEKYEHEYPLAAFIIRNCSYVDDVLYANSDITAVLEAKGQLQQLLRLGGFETHKWSSNHTPILSDIPASHQQFDELDLQRNDLKLKALGLTIDNNKDCFIISCPETYNTESVTKRDILSYISKFYDPMGFVSPIIVKAKAIMQKLWSEHIDWNATPCGSLKGEWLQFAQNLAGMDPIFLKRNIPVNNTATAVQIIGFSDASSTTGYGCCVYLRVVDQAGKATLSLLCSKSRINPLSNKLSVPRLELNAAMLLTKVVSRVYDTLKLKLKIDDVFLFTDSQIVLAWLATEPTQLQAYVANRVSVIQRQTGDWQWLYVNTADNPADLVSRGVEPHQLASCKLWWDGPLFLQDKYDFTSNKASPPEVLPELKPSSAHSSASVSVATHTGNTFIEAAINKFSDINKMVRVVAYFLRFVNYLKAKIKNKKERLQFKTLTSIELQRALALVIKHEQGVYYSDDIHAIKTNKPVSASLLDLHVFLDKEGILRVGGRLHNSNLSYSQKHPIVLCKGSKVTELIIRSEHVRLLHAGPGLILSSLNQRLWLLNGIREIKKVTHKCIICFKLKAKAAKQLMGSLPCDRVTKPARPFQKVGLDFLGPVEVKQSRVRRALVGKGYVCVFVCFSTKAVHLELCSDLTTATFLACFKRFISRRGMPTDCYCDNASTFKSAKTQLTDLYKLNNSRDHQTQVQNFASELHINFHFIPCYSPVFGGLWEAAVKSTKFHLKRTIQKALLTYEELNTVLSQIEAVLNSRPLIPMTANCDDYTYLTPGHFLIGTAITSYPEPDVSEVPLNRLKMWRICTHMVQSFWKLWHRHYLNILQHRPKWQVDEPNIKVGSLVLLIEKDTPPMNWPMARVIRVCPGGDGKVRAFEVKTPNGRTHLRSITKVCALPIQ